jgi:hypothetical protein
MMRGTTARKKTTMGFMNRLRLIILSIVAFYALVFSLAMVSTVHAQGDDVIAIAVVIDAGPVENSELSAPGEAAAKTEAEKIADAPIQAVGDGVSAIRDGDWRKVAALALSLMMFGLSKARSRIAFFKGDRGGVIAIFFLSASGALVTSLVGGNPIDFKMFSAAAEIAALSIGGFVGIRKFIWPDDKKPIPTATAIGV